MTNMCDTPYAFECICGAVFTKQIYWEYCPFCGRRIKEEGGVVA